MRDANGKGKARMVISIKPEYAERIIAGEKRFEFRKKAPGRDVEELLLYSTAPVKAIVASAEIARVIKGTPEEVWEQAKGYAGIAKEGFLEYFDGADTAYAYELCAVQPLLFPIKLAEMGIKRAPQSFCYIKGA